MTKQLILVLGGALCGKSTYAEARATQLGGSILYAGTAQSSDPDVIERMDGRREARPPGWRTLEAPLNLGVVVRDAGWDHDVVLVDSLTNLAANVVKRHSHDASQHSAAEALLAEVDDLLAAYVFLNATWLIVSDEIGMSPEPRDRLDRLVRYALGRANQRLARVADEVILVVAGLPWPLKGKP